MSYLNADHIKYHQQRPKVISSIDARVGFTETQKEKIA
jgi:hypothetical protein